MTAASKTLPLGSVVKVTNPENGRSVKVRINDRGPYVPGRSLDLSKKAAEKLGVTKKGVVKVKVTPVEKHPHVIEAKATDKDSAPTHVTPVSAHPASNGANVPSTDKNSGENGITPVAAHPDTDGNKSPAVDKGVGGASITPVTDHPATDGAKAPAPAQSPAGGNTPASAPQNPSVSEN